MERYRQPFALLVCILLLSSACEKKLDFEEDELEPVLAVYGFPEPGESLNMRVSASRSTLQDDFLGIPPLEDCTLSLSKDGEEVETVSEMSSNVYPFQTIIEEGHQYSVRVDHANHTAVSAATSTPSAPSNLEVEVVDQSDGLTVEVTFDDNADANRYQLLVVVDNGNNQYLTGWSTSSEYFELDPLEGESYFYENGFFLDDLFENGQAKLRLNVDYFDYGYGDSGLRIIVRSCSEPYYLFYRSRYLFRQGELGFFAEPVQIYSNVNSGLGAFGGFNDAMQPIIQ